MILLVASICSEAVANLTPTQRKAAIIAKIEKYVSDANDDRRVTIGFLGGGEVSELVRSVFADDRSVTVIPVRTPADASKCEVVFVAAGSNERWKSLRQTAPWVLSIGESRSFSAAGGVLMLLPDGKGNFQLLYSKTNYTTAKRAGLKMSVRLLKIATKVD